MGNGIKQGDEVPEINTPASSDSRYTKTDINRMSVSDLRQIVMGTGVENGGHYDRGRNERVSD